MSWQYKVETWDTEATRDKVRSLEGFPDDLRLADIDRDLYAMKKYIQTLEEDLAECKEEVEKWRRRCKAVYSHDWRTVDRWATRRGIE